MAAVRPYDHHRTGACGRRHPGLDRLDAQLLLLQALNRPVHERTWLLAHDGDTLSEAQRAGFKDLMRRRLAGEPVAYLTGRKEFFGLELQVDARVLVPRPDTETLVEWAIERLDGLSHEGSVLDLGTGSGAVALAIKHARPQARVSALDFNADALAVARANALKLKLDVSFSQGSWLEGVTGRFDLIVSNPPYIAAADPHLSALIHEPLLALASGADGLDDIRTIVREASGHLTPGGWLLMEHGFDQAGRVRQLFADAGWSNVQSRQDLAGIERCSGGQWSINYKENGH